MSLRDLLTATAVLVGDSSAETRKYRRFFDHVFDVDFETNPTDGWEWSRAALHLEGRPSPAILARSRQRLRAAIDSIPVKRRERAYILGTGPSLAKASAAQFANGTVIICNTIVRDGELWRELKPDFFVAADAIYHFGHTLHARTFREDLRRRLSESSGRTLFVYPELFDATVRREFAEFTEILVPVPMGTHAEVAVDLRQQFELPALGNVLNVVLLPLACTVSKSVYMWGFDGRAPDDKLFWSNSSKHAYPELMHTLQTDHPAFFAGFVPRNNESSYVKSVHGDALEMALRRGEAAGWEFVMMHFSWTETLNRRARAASEQRPGV